MEQILLERIGIVKNSRQEISDDYWGGIISEIVIDDKFPEDCLKGIEDFSHLEIIFYFDKGDKSKIVTGAKHPRGNEDWPETGIFAMRAKSRPNMLGATIVKLVKKEGRSLYVSGLDAIDNTPVLDIKPVLKEFMPREEIIQPEWASELMQKYWRS
jgi:tRNA-Thr(GGU) m(6)t(6)A37 methyltransferase TsaA